MLSNSKMLFLFYKKYKSSINSLFKKNLMYIKSVAFKEKKDN